MKKIKKTKEEWKKILTKEEYKVLIEKSTEIPFTGEYNDNKKKGVYYCKACKNKLFSSDKKFDSGTGWPSFTFPTSKDSLEKKEDSFLMKRTEVLCNKCGSHLGHVFDDGPKGKKRYCINSIALKFKEK